MPGYINNVHGTVTFPTSGAVFDNAALVKKDYNTVETKGGRAALKVDLGDNWTILPTMMGQTQQTDGDFAYNPAVGDLEVQHWFPQNVHDSWVQSALTVEGKISNFDIVYAGAYLTRNTHEQSDYTDYSLFYDTQYGSGEYFLDNAGNLVNPAQTIIGRDHYSKYSNELRVSSPKDFPFTIRRGTVPRAPGARNPAGLRCRQRRRSTRFDSAQQHLRSRLAGHDLADRPRASRPRQRDIRRVLL